MSGIYNSADSIIGRTPLLRLCRIREKLSLDTDLLAKLEYLNPAGSVKDRAAKYMIDAAERDGLLSAGSVIIEPTSGNTGIGICSVAAARGYKAIIVMPDSMSQERIRIMQAYGAQVVLTDGALGMSGSIAKARQLAKSIPNSFIPGQFSNPENARAHFESTGPEIWEDTEGNIDVFVAGVGTGGTLTGVGSYLKSKDPNIRIVAVEPAGSAVLSGNAAGKHGLQGIGAGFVPELLDTSVYDEIITVSDDEAMEFSRLMAQYEGVLVGISSGAALCAASKISRDGRYVGKRIVTLLPDSGERYLSTALFSK